MSSGMLLLAGLFATGPVTAPPCETAPMPRAKRGMMQLELRFDLTPRGLTFGAGLGPAQPAPYRVEAGHGLRIEVPQLGPNACPSAALPLDLTANVRETRTGQFMITGGVNSHATPSGDIILVERNVARYPAYCPKPHVLACPGPVGPPPEIHAMMLQAIGQMGGPVAAPQPPMCPVEQPRRPLFVMPVYEGGGNNDVVPLQQFLAQHACPPVPAQACLPPVPVQATWSAAPTVGRTMPIGVWSREVGPVRYKIEFKGQTLIATTTLTEEDDDGKSFTVDHTLTADWYPTRNEHEIVGLITGFDLSTSGKVMKRDDVSGLLGSLADIQKQLNGKPIALTCRFTGDAMMIGDVRLPGLKNDYEELSSAFAAMGGNYEAAKVQSPAVLVVPASLGRTSRPRLSGMTLPSPKYLQHQPQYFPDDPAFPLPRELSVPEAPPQRIGVDFNFNPPRFHGYDRLPPMPPPVPLPRTNPFRNGGVSSECSDDSNVRMRQLLHQSEESGPIGEEWLRFWFHDQPSHLTPERIHGGIILNQPQRAVPPMPSPLPLPQGNPFRDGRFNW